MSSADTFIPLDKAALSRVLPWLLATPGMTLTTAQLQAPAFLRYLELCPIRWEGWLAGAPAAPHAVALLLILPGATGILLVPVPGTHDIDVELQTQLTAHALRAAAPHRLHYVQALLAPEAHAQRALVEQLGFSTLAPLVYLERDMLFPWSDPPRPDEADWVPYSPATHTLFGEVVLATYQASADCPELAGLRPIDDILAAHQASGPFDPTLWQLAVINGVPQGVVLLSTVASGDMLELAYMGVVPAARGRQLGALLLRQALACGRARRIGRLTLVVDDRNTPAKRLYARFALRPVGRRNAFLLRPARV